MSGQNSIAANLACALESTLFKIGWIKPYSMLVQRRLACYFEQPVFRFIHICEDKRGTAFATTAIRIRDKMKCYAAYW
jgi:hypothetical protein